LIIQNFGASRQIDVGFMKDHLPLPGHWTIESVCDYLGQLVSFVTEYENVAKFNSHDVFLTGLPVEWAVEHSLDTWILIMSGESLDRLSDEFAREFSKFVRLSRVLPLVDETRQNKSISKKQRKGMTPKKDHEVDAMVTFIDEVTGIHSINVNNVLDVGSGLGYLSLELSKDGYNVVGVEADPERAKKAAVQVGFPCIARKVKSYYDLDIIKEACISVSLRMTYG
jgi:hypothetical protein